MMPTPGPAPTAAPTAASATAPAGVVTPPMSPQAVENWGRFRRRVDVVRSQTGRVATVAGAAAAVGVVADPGTLVPALAATAAVVASGAGLLRLQMPHAGHQRATATVLYTVPGVSLGVLLIAERVVAGAAWGGTLAMQVLAVAVWTGGTWLLRPARVARRMATPPPPPVPATDTAAVAGVGVDAHPAARWWGEHAAGPDGPAVGTVLQDIEVTGDRAMRAVIRATTPGRPVPDISIRRLSALLDWPEDQIAIGPVPRRGAGVRRLTIGTADQAEASGGDPTTVWAERIAPKAMPGAVLTGVRVGRPGTPAPASASQPDLDAVPAGASDHEDV